MMPTDQFLVSLCAAIYRPLAVTGEWDHFDAGLDDGVCWALRKLPGFDVIVFRGSITLQDWVRDLRAIAVPTRIGHVHAGFYAGMEHVWEEAKPFLSQPVVLTGHSLGAARAAVMAALMVKDRAPPASRVVFGEPKPGLVDFAKVIESVPARSYRNGDATHHDLVCDVPLTFPPFQYVHPTPIVPVTCAPDPSRFDSYGAFAWHHVELYQAALAAINLETAA
jgi:hypothetical protein